MKRVDLRVIERWRKAEKAWFTAVRHRLVTFEDSFQKHADLCPHCYALIVWQLGAPKQQCRRCKSYFNNDSST